MRTLATAVAMATVLTVPAAAKTLLKNPQRLLPDYVSASDVKNIPNPYIDQRTEGYPPDQVGQQMMVAAIVFLFTTAAPALTWLEVSINKTSSFVLSGA